MTEKCYNELLNLLLVDIATTQRDRNPANLFLYKGKNDKLWQGVICIDNGRTLQNENYHCFGQENLTIKELATRLWNNDNIITYGGIKTLQNEHSRSSLPDIITQTNNLIQDGTFNKSQIDIIKKIKEYDISKTIDKTENSKHLKVDSKQKDLMKYMWEKVQNSFEL
jgi:hypothetical protein